MGTVFNMSQIRTVTQASRNCFLSPIKHPSRTLNEHVISYVLQGNWDLCVGEERIQPSKDCVFIQPAHSPHSGVGVCAPNTVTMFVHFSFAEGDRMAAEENTAFSKGEIYIGNLIDVSAYPRIKEWMAKIAEEKAKDNVVKACAYLQLLLCELSECCSTPKDEYAVKIRGIILQHLKENLKNEEIARMVNVSVRTAESSFRARYKMTMHQFVLEQKAKQAKFLLEYYPNVKIGDIANELGFYDEYHFSRQFKKATGCSPKQYRQSVLQTK